MTEASESLPEVRGWQEETIFTINESEIPKGKVLRLEVRQKGKEEIGAKKREQKKKRYGGERQSGFPNRICTREEQRSEDRGQTDYEETLRRILETQTARKRQYLAEQLLEYQGYKKVFCRILFGHDQEYSGFVLDE